MLVKNLGAAKTLWIDSIKYRLVGLQNFLMFQAVLFLNRKHLGSIKLERYGSAYGGWWVPTEIPDRLQNKTLVSAGLGFDTSFDEALLQRGWSVIGIDPLQECCEGAIKNLGKFPKIQIMNVGLSVKDGYQSFFQPKNPVHDSWSTINAQFVVDPLSKQFPVVSLKKIALNAAVVDAEFRYLKMDIEGAELALFQESKTDFLGYDFLAVEIDFLSLIPFRKFRLRIRRVWCMRRILRELNLDGWALVHVEKSNFFWGRSPKFSV